MFKSVVIATCLVNSGFSGTIDEGESKVRYWFGEIFPESDFSKWNSNLNDGAAGNIIKTVGRASSINVARFIWDLWNPADPQRLPREELQRRLR